MFDDFLFDPTQYDEDNEIEIPEYDRLVARDARRPVERIHSSL